MKWIRQNRKVRWYKKKVGEHMLLEELKRPIEELKNRVQEIGDSL